MNLASANIRDLLQGKTCGITCGSTHREGDQDLINVKARVFASKIFGLQLLDRMDGIRGDHVELVINTCKLFQCIEEKSCRCTQKVGSFSAYDLSVRKLQSGGRASGCFFFFEGSRNNLTVSDLGMSLLEKKLDLTYLILCAGAGNQSVEKYDAFDDVGGKLSFALALLDKNNTGLILNAVHSRDNCFLYLKEIVKGESYVVLSQEEVEALRKAVNFGLGEIEKE